MTLTPPTLRQLEVLDALEQFRFERGYSPTVRELADAVGISSTNGMADHLAALRKKGCIDSDSLRARTLRLTDHGVTHLMGYRVRMLNAEVADAQ